MCKLGAVETNNSPNNYETGDRYLLKLYRLVNSQSKYKVKIIFSDHLFRHDMSHIVQSLNKLDIGSPERFLLRLVFIFYRNFALSRPLYIKEMKN